MGTSQHRIWGATTLGFRRWRTESPRFLPTVARRPVVLARRVDAPAGVSATAAPDRSPSPPRLGCPRRAARLHRILIALGPRRPPRSLQTPRLFAPGHRGTGAPGLGVRSWQGLPWGPASSSACPSSSASAGPGVPGAETGECSTPTSTSLGGWSQPGPDWRAGARIV